MNRLTIWISKLSTGWKGVSMKTFNGTIIFIFLAIVRLFAIWQPALSISGESWQTGHPIREITISLLEKEEALRVELQNAEFDRKLAQEKSGFAFGGCQGAPHP